MSGNALYTDLSGYYDLMCADIDYQAQSHCVHRVQQMFGNTGTRHLDLACGTGPHVRHFLDKGYASAGLDINQPMLDKAQLRCPEARFSLQDMCSFVVDQPQDLITCFLYSLHYSATLKRLSQCFQQVHQALAPQGLFCFNAVDKEQIDNDSFVAHSIEHAGEHLRFSSGWYYACSGEAQRLRLRIEKRSAEGDQIWDDEHPMVAVSFTQLQALLEPLFEVTVLAHDYQRLQAWDGQQGNALFVCVKREPDLLV